jgi:hypothetical protein
MSGSEAWPVPGGLPAGGFVVPDPSFLQGQRFTEPALWITDQPVADPGPLFARLLAGHRETGLWPLLLTEQLPGAGRPWHKGELRPVPDRQADGLDAAQLLAARWEREAGLKPERFDFGEGAFPGVPRSGWPGLADPATPGRDPDEAAASVVTTPGALSQLTPYDDSIFLGLVPAADGAAALTACGWLSNAGSSAELAAVIRSWQRRFGARLCAIGSDTIGLSVAWPPATPAHARRVAAEHAAFCRETAYGADLSDYAGEMLDASVWGFWWE